MFLYHSFWRLYLLQYLSLWGCQAGRISGGDCGRGSEARKKRWYLRFTPILRVGRCYREDMYQA